MRYPASEKLEIIKLVESSYLLPDITNSPVAIAFNIFDITRI